MINYFEDHTSRSIEQLISLNDKGSVVTGGADGIGAGTVSYTHLTLPTIFSV